jgi:protein SCO1
MRGWPWISLTLVLLALPSGAGRAATVLDETAALRLGQAALGRQLDDRVFADATGRRIALSDFRGKPLLINLVYTSCSSVCPTIVQTLDAAIGVAQQALGEDSFAVATVGFDWRHDTPQRMRAFARAQGIDRPNWWFLSGDGRTVDALTEQVGFAVYPAPQGFDHMALTTVVDQDGRVYRQIYGAAFEAPAVVEPLKQLVLGRRSDWTSLEGLVNRVRLFCTLYDPRTGAYRFDSSPFIALAIGLAALAGVGGFALREWRRSVPGRART